MRLVGNVGFHQYHAGVICIAIRPLLEHKPAVGLRLQGQLRTVLDTVGLRGGAEFIAFHYYRVILRSKERDETNE